MSMPKATRTVDIPDYEGHTAVVRRIGWKALDEAAQPVQKRTFEMIKNLGAEEIQKLFAVSGVEGAVQQQASTSDPFLQYDKGILLNKGVVSWTRDEPVSPDELDDLTTDAAMALARAVFELSRPRTEAETKNA